MQRDILAGVSSKILIQNQEMALLRLKQTMLKKNAI